MTRKIFVNLPVTDLQRSTAFYQAVGAALHPEFSNDTASCMVFSDEIYTMLLTHDKYREFTAKPIADTQATSAVLIALAADSRDEVDDIFGRALAAGGKEARPASDHGFMVDRAFEDPDGHVWEIFWMDMEAAKAAMSAPAEA